MSVFVSSLLAQGDAYEWIYKGSDGEIYAAEPNLADGDAFSWSWLLPDLNTSNFSWNDAVSTSFLEDGLTIYFGSKSKYYRQYFDNGDDSNPSFSLLGAPTDITERYYEIENSKGIDLDGDGFEGTPPPTISKVLIHRDAEPHWGEAYYLTTQGDLISSQDARKYAAGDIHDSQTIYFNDFSPENFSKDQIIAREGLDTLWFYNQSTGKLYQQNFKEGSEWEIRIPSGSASDLTSQINSLEESWGVDINRNGIVGERKPVVEKIIFEDSYSDRFLYLLDDGSYIVTEGGYDTGDTMSGGQKISGADASLLNNALAFNWIENGFELLIRDAASGGFAIQRFSEIGGSNNYSKAGNLKPIDQKGDKFFYWETDRSLDFNNDGSIGEKDTVVRSVLLPSSVGHHDEGFYQTTDDKIIMVREDLQQGESPADWYRELVNQSGDPYDFKDGPKAFDWANRGFVVVFQEGADFKLQKFNESNDVATASGSTRLITKSLSDWEEKTSVDIDGNGSTGEESATVQKVLYTGLEGHVENGVYLDQNGDLIFGEPDLVKGDIVSFSRQFLDKNGNSFEPDIDLRAMDWGDRGPTLVYQSKNKYYMQQFREVGDAMTANGQARDISGKISRYEEQFGVDIDKDGFYGEQLPEITEVLFDGLDGYREVGVYRTSSQSVVISDSGLVKGETPNFVSNVVDKDGNPFEFGDRVAGVGDARGGFTLVYQDGNKYMEQIFKELSDFSRPNGKPKNVTSRLAKLEEQYSIDLDNNGKYGKEAAVITGVLFDGSEGFSGRGIYRLQTGDLIASESEMSVGDTPNYYLSIVNENGYPFEPGARLAGLRDARSGFSILYLSDDSSKYYEQIFKEIGDFARPNGKSKNITNKIKKLEDDLAIDLDLDGLFGRQDPAVLRVHYSGGEGQLEAGLYTLQNGDLILAGSDLEIDDTPRNATTFVDTQGESFVVSGVAKGISSSSKGVDLIYLNGGVFYAQPFRETRDYLRQNGKPRNITKSIYKLENTMDYDFTGDGLFGKPDAVVQGVALAGKNQEFGLYEMSDATFLIAESGLRKGDTPFEFVGQLASKSKNNEAYSLQGNPTGVVQIKNGYAVIMESGGKYLAQQFGFSGDMLREKGKASNITSKIEKYEADYFVDFNGDNAIGPAE